MTSPYPDPADEADIRERLAAPHRLSHELSRKLPIPFDDRATAQGFGNRIADDAADLAADGIPPDDAMSVADMMDGSDAAAMDAEIMDFQAWRRHWNDGVRARMKQFEEGT